MPYILKKNLEQFLALQEYDCDYSQSNGTATKCTGIHAGVAAVTARIAAGRYAATAGMAAGSARKAVVSARISDVTAGIAAETPALMTHDAGSKPTQVRREKMIEFPLGMNFSNTY